MTTSDEVDTFLKMLRSYETEQIRSAVASFGEDWTVARLTGALAVSHRLDTRPLANQLRRALSPQGLVSGVEMVMSEDPTLNRSSPPDDMRGNGLVSRSDVALVYLLLAQNTDFFPLETRDAVWENLCAALHPFHVGLLICLLAPRFSEAERLDKGLELAISEAEGERGLGLGLLFDYEVKNSLPLLRVAILERARTEDSRDVRARFFELAKRFSWSRQVFFSWGWGKAPYQP